MMNNFELLLMGIVPLLGIIITFFVVNGKMKAFQKHTADRIRRDVTTYSNVIDRPTSAVGDGAETKGGEKMLTNAPEPKE